MKMIIGGVKTDAKDGATIDVLNPATLEKIDTIPKATKEDMDRAIKNAQDGFKQWRATPLYKRIDILKNFLSLYKENGEELAQYLMQEVGKPITQARACISGSAELIEQFIEKSRFVGGETMALDNRPGTEGDVLLTIREPLGVVAAILPFNYPIDLITHKVIPALLMGNAVIVKPATDTPLADIRYVDLLLEAGVPGNVVQIVTGSGRDIGAWLSNDDRISVLTLTGSTEVGIEIAKNGANHLARVHLELGGNDAAIVLADTDLDKCAEALMSRLENAGQTCCATKRIVVDNTVKDALIEKLIANINTKKVGDPTDPNTDVGPLVSLRAAKDVEAQIAHCVSQGAKLLLGGKRFNETFIEPTVIDAPKTADVASDLEIFGPVFTVIGFDTVDEAIEIANSSIFGLSSAVFGTNISMLMHVAKSLEAGGCAINSSTQYRSPDQAFGGYKMSGIGREGASITLEEMSQVKTIIITNTNL